MQNINTSVHLPLLSQNATVVSKRHWKGAGMLTKHQLILTLTVTVIFLFTFILKTGTANGQPVKAFPTAEGFGANSVGGRGGRIIEVTNLNDSGPGSLRQALQKETGPRIVVFRIGGTIDISAGGSIRIKEENSFVTVAGQTAPGGIQLKGEGIYIIGAHDVIIRHMRFRAGTNPNESGGQTNNIGFSTFKLDNTRAYNLIIDHCSSEWSTDENATVWGWVTDSTFQWCIFAEGTNEGHQKGGHSAGMLVGGGGGEKTTLSIHHSLFAHNGMRNPLIAKAKIVDFRNNVVYNWGTNKPPKYNGHNSVVIGKPGQAANVNFVNNHYIKGPNSTNTKFLGHLDGGSVGTKIYTQGNWGPVCPTGCKNDWDNGFKDRELYRIGETGFPASESKYRVLTPFSSSPVTTDPTSSVKDIVLAGVGATVPLRDSVDSRIVNDVKNLTGNIKNNGGGGPWPVLGGGLLPLDTDNDGMPDAWELSHSLNPKDSTDGSKTAKNGYTNVENYLNELAGDPVSMVPRKPSDLQAVAQ